MHRSETHIHHFVSLCQSVLLVPFLRHAYPTKYYLENILASPTSVWKSWLALEKEGHREELAMFLKRGEFNFSHEFVNKVHPLAMRMIEKNRGWDVEFLVETATHCLLLRKVAAAFLVVLEVEELNPPQSKLELLLLFENIRQKITHRLYSDTLPKDIETIQMIQTNFLSGVFSHDPSVVTNYMSYAEGASPQLFKFLRFCNRKRWTEDKLEKAAHPPTTSFCLMKPEVIKNKEKVAQDPFLSHCKRVEALSRMWFEQAEMEDGGVDFLSFVEMNDWQKSVEWLKERREPLEEVRGFKKRGKKSSRMDVTVKSQVKRIKKLNGDVKRGPRAGAFNENEHGDISKLIGEAIKLRSIEMIESNANRSMAFDLVPPPVSRVSSPEPFSDLESQLTDIPVTQSACEEAKCGSSEIEEDVTLARDEIIQQFKLRWRHWTLIPRPSFYETNNFGCQMLTSALRVFLDAIIGEGLHHFPSKLMNWLKGLDAIVLFEIARATALFIAVLYRNSEFHVVVVDGYLDRTVPMAVTFFVECVLEAADQLKQPRRARWFWRVIAQMLGKDETTAVLTLWRQNRLDSIFDIERKHWKGFSDFSPHSPPKRPEETQSLIDHVHADGM